MKRILSLVLILAMTLCLFAACEQKPATTGDEATLADAKEYLYAMYKDRAENTAVNYSVVGTVKIGTTSYTVTWAVDNDSIKITPNGQFYTIEIPKTIEEISYKLTATISDAAGNKETQEFNYKVPASAGLPANIADGTYVILAGNLTMSSLDESKGYGYPTANAVTVADGAVSGHFKADVLTITNVTGGVTIQDAFGRYFYLKGTYNSFNVDATAPAEGHIWEVLKNGDNYIFVNATNGKTLAYSTSYTSWGAYPELTDDHTSLLTVVAATAPETDPEVPGTPEIPEQPGDTTLGVITAPVAGTAYKLALVHGGKGNAMLYFTGAEKPNYPWYMLSTTNEAEAVDVFVEEVDGGLRLYFMASGTKTYLDMHKDGTHYSLRLTTEPTAVYTWNTEYKTFVATVEDKECFIGTSGTYDTFSCNKMDYIADSYPAHLYGEGGTAETPENPETPEAPATLAEQIAEAAKLANKEYLAYESTITGTITDDPAESSYTAGSYKFTVSDGTNTLLCYYVPVSGGTPAKGDTITVTGKLTAYNGTAQFDSTATATLGEGGSTETPENPDTPSTSDVELTAGMKVVIYIPSEGKALSSVATGNNLSGVDVALTDGVLSGYGDTEIWTVIVNADGTYSFEQNGVKLGMQDSYASVSMGSVNDTWEVISLGEGLYNIKNVVRGNYMDWYSGKFSTYNQGSPATDPAFQIAFFIVE